MVIAFSGGGTGGHFYPSVAIAAALARELPGAEAFFVGCQGRLEGQELPKMGYPHKLLTLRGLRHPIREMRRARGPAKISRFVGAAAGAAAAIWLFAAGIARVAAEMRRRRVRAVVLTGGYVAAPAGAAAWLLGLPVVVQEQNIHPGLVTRLTSRWARQIHVAFPETVSALPAAARPRARVSGNPIRPLPPSAEQDKKLARKALGLPASGSVVLVVGGSQGAAALNRATAELLRAELPRDGEFVFWVTGPGDYAEAAAEFGEGAGRAVRAVRAVPYLGPDDMYRALAAADLAVSRAGAMATSEFLAWGVPAVLVPLPTAAEDHQAKNARALAAAGAAVHVAEHDPAEGALGGERLWGEARRLLDDPAALARMAEAARERARPRAAREIAAAVAGLVATPDSGAGS